MRIGYATHNLRSHYWLIVNHGVRERANELGIEVLTTPSYTLDQQVAAINAFVEQRVDVLLLGPVVTTGLAGTLKRVRAAGIPIIALAVGIDDYDVACTVRSDHRNGAELAAAYMVEQIGGAGDVAHLMGPSHLHDNVERARGVRHVLSQYPAVNIVFEKEIPDWKPETGAAFMREALNQCPGVRGVCVANDTLAAGAITAIEEAGRCGAIVVTGFDATPDALIAIHEGRMSATVRQSMREIGRIGVEMAHRAISGEAVPSLVLTDTPLVTQANLIDTALESVYLLPPVLRNVVERSQALAHARDEIIQTQQLALRELSTPLIPISDTVMIMPLIGSINLERAQQVIDTLAAGVASNRARTVILDITGVLMVDTHIANALLQAAQIVNLLGARVVLTGIRPEVAQTLVGLGADLGDIVTQGTVQSGIAYAMQQR